MDKKTVLLPNGLEVLLINDPSLNKSACALDISIGSFEDPNNKQGLAHLLEHMFFMGTKKYPKKGEFHEYVSSNQGVFNASTGLEHANYRFEIDHTALDSALDRFSQFFIYPELNLDSIESEKKVIDTEFSRNRMDEQLRLQRLFHLSSVKDHPITQFHHGNIKTLKTISRDDLYDFFEHKYSANLMKLVVMSKLELEQLENIIFDLFLDIRNNNISRPLYSSPVIDVNALPQHIKMFSKSSSRSLKLCFEIFSLYPKYRSKPAWIFNFILNNSRKGSLINELKRDGLITEMWSSSNSLSFTGFIFIDVKLTEKGCNNVDKILEKFFSYIELIKKIGYPDYIYEEQKIIADIGYRFKEYREGFNFVKNIAKNMHYYPAMETELFNDLLFDYEVSPFNDLLSKIDPNSVKVLSTCTNGDFDEKETFYGIKYSVAKLSSDKYRTSPLSCNNFKYPDRNLFIPKDFTKISDDLEPLPHKVISDEKGVFWFVQSKDELPLAYINILILTKEVNNSPKSKLLSVLYTRLVEATLIDISDMAGEAGFSFGVERDDRGISLFFVGYSDKIDTLIKAVVEGLIHNFDDQALLDNIKSELLADYGNLLNGSSYDLAMYQKSNLVHVHNIHFSEYLDYLSNVTVEEINSLVNKMYKNIYLESHSYGNISPNKLISIRNLIFKSLNASTLASVMIPKDQIISLKDGQTLECNLQISSADNCWASFFEFGHRSLRLSATIQLGYVILEPFFFNYMRNKKQMAYVVETRLDFFEDILGLSFSVLSDKYDPEKIEQEAGKAFSKFIDELDNISEEQLCSNKKALINKIKKTNRTLEEWMSEVVLTAILRGDQQYGEKLATEIELLSIDDIKKVFCRTFNKETRKCISVKVSGN